MKAIAMNNISLLDKDYITFSKLSLLDKDYNYIQQTEFNYPD